MRIIGLIPARLESTRLPGKPLKLIAGLPMIAHVYFRSRVSSALDDLYVCSDSLEIETLCNKLDIPHVMTSSQHTNGTERCGEAASILGLEPQDIVIDIQGDEPLVDPEHITAVSKEARLNHADIVVPHLLINEADENIVKVVSSTLDNRILYLSRANVPYAFRGEEPYKKHLSIISFSMRALTLFCSSHETALEKIEGVELLRAIELGLCLRTIRLRGESRAVDTQKDLDFVRVHMELDPYFIEYKHTKIKLNE